MAKHIGLGFTVMMSTAGSTTYSVTLGQVRGISGPSIAADTVETHDLTATDNYKTFDVGYIDGGEVTMTLAYDPSLSAHTELKNLCDGRQETDFKIIFPTTTIFVEFSSFVTGLAPEIPLGELVTAEATFKVTGKPTFPSTT